MAHSGNNKRRSRRRLTVNCTDMYDERVVSEEYFSREADDPCTLSVCNNSDDTGQCERCTYPPRADSSIAAITEPSYCDNEPKNDTNEEMMNTGQVMALVIRHLTLALSVSYGIQIICAIISCLYHTPEPVAIVALGIILLHFLVITYMIIVLFNWKTSIISRQDDEQECT